MFFCCCLHFPVTDIFYSSVPLCLAGILFSTLVFGPACGFILGSVCTKVYVDAVFIDTSELAFILCVHFLRYILEFFFTLQKLCLYRLNWET